MKKTQKSTQNKRVLVVTAIATGLVLNASLQLRGEQPAADDGPVANVRPSKGPEAPVSVSTHGAIRGSLFRQGAEAPVPMGSDGQPIGDAPVSFFSVQAAIPKKFKKNDIVTIIVEQDSNYVSNAQGNAEKKQSFDLALQQFIQLAASSSGLPSVGVVGQPSKLPEIKFNYDNNRQNTASQQRQDTLSYRISATIVDVKPNGTCVLEAVAKISVDNDVQTFKLSGICRAEDVTPDNTVLSTQLADLTTSKKTSGEVRDGVRRGWLNKLIDQYNPL